MNFICQLLIVLSVDDSVTLKLLSHLELQNTIVYSTTLLAVTTLVTLSTTNADFNGICFDSTNNKLYVVIFPGTIYSISLSGSSATALSFSG